LFIAVCQILLLWLPQYYCVSTTFGSFHAENTRLCLSLVRIVVCLAQTFRNLHGLNVPLLFANVLNLDQEAYENFLFRNAERVLKLGSFDPGGSCQTVGCLSFETVEFQNLQIVQTLAPSALKRQRVNEKFVKLCGFLCSCCLLIRLLCRFSSCSACLTVMYFLWFVKGFISH
jgi:hypothetical protein